MKSFVCAPTSRRISNHFCHLVVSSPAPVVGPTGDPQQQAGAGLVMSESHQIKHGQQQQDLMVLESSQSPRVSLSS